MVLTPPEMAGPSGHEQANVSERVEWLADRDSNPDKQNQNLLCYHYTIGQR